MRIVIEAGDHEPKWHHVILDNHGMLVDLGGCPGPIADPLVFRIVWDDDMNDNGWRGCIYRRTAGSNAIGEQRLADVRVIKPYVARYLARKAEIERGLGAS